MIDRKHIKDTFIQYTNQYNASDIRVRLKVEHTFHVASISERIAQSLKLSPSDIDLAWILGMFHDIARFEQLKQYDTFIDSQSVDHAEFGADLLFNSRLIDDYLTPDDFSAERKLMEQAIRLHNKLRLPDDLDERTRMFSQILRDADKIDIFRVQVEIPFDEIHNFSQKELLTSAISDVIMQGIYDHCCVDRNKHKRNAIEAYVSHCMLAFELVYPESYRITKEQGYLDQQLAFRTQNEDTNKKLAIIEAEMNKVFDEMLTLS